MGKIPRLYEEITCPYCGHTDFISFHCDADTLFCNNCNREFAIELEMTVTVKTGKIFDKKCCSCHAPLYNEEIVNGKCPNCQNNTVEDDIFKTSELDIPNRSTNWINLP